MRTKSTGRGRTSATAGRERDQALWSSSGPAAPRDENRGSQGEETEAEGRAIPDPDRGEVRPGQEAVQPGSDHEQTRCDQWIHDQCDLPGDEPGEAHEGLPLIFVFAVSDL